MKRTFVFKMISIVIVIFLMSQIGNAVPPEGFDFTVPADAPYVEGELLVRFAPKMDGEQRSVMEKSQILSSLGGGTIKGSFRIVPGLTLVKLPARVMVKDALKTFNKTDGILDAQPNYILRADSTFPNDPNGPKPAPYGGDLWGMHNIGQTGGTPDADIDAPEAWDIATDSNIIVAVIDSGVDYNHPDLAANMWVNEAEFNGTSGIDDDGNGYVDDIYGYDFCTFQGKQRDSDPNDDAFHGTHCAGIIGAVGNNGEGVTGVCWNIKIMSVQFMRWAYDPDWGWSIWGETADAIDCIDYAVEMGAKVLSNSWGGGPYNTYLLTAIETAGTSGVLFIASAGNNHSDNDEYPYHFPSSYGSNNIIAVLSTDHYDAMSYFSNYGPLTVDLGAPGSDILSTFPTYETDAMIYNGFSTYYETISGTSMAAPHVAGACALLWSMNPALSHLEVKDIILNSVDELDVLEWRCVTGGRLNLHNALLNTPGILAINKDDNVNNGDCVSPGDEITYTISYAYPEEPNIGNINDVKIIDYLPDDVYYDSFDFNYNPVAHTYTWSIGTLSPGDEGSVELMVTVNECITGCGVITNLCKAKSGNSLFGFAFENTPVCSASNPFPACDAKVDLYVNGLKLIWCPGHFAADTDGHDVYFGTNEYEVANMTPAGPDPNNVYIGRQTEIEYELTNLDLLTTYYWRIDEVNEANICQGIVLSFTTSDFYVIDDFEYYTISDPEGDSSCPYYDGNDQRIDLNNDMRFWWLDGHFQKNPQGDCGGDYEDYNPLVIEKNFNYLPGSRIIRTNYGRTGYGMSYYYDNNDVDNGDFPPEPTACEDHYSEILRYYADANGVDFTLKDKIDVNRAILVLYYKGNSDNAVDPKYDRMYVVLEDTDEVYCDSCSSCNYCRGDDAQIDHNDPDAALATVWTQWKIKLSDFNEINPDINFDSIRSVRIGFGLRGNWFDETPGGEGTVIFDDIRLYPCSEADLDGDCDVDFYDYSIFAAAWLTNLGQPNYDPNCDLAESNEIDCNDLAFFCDDWLLGASLNLEEAISMGLGGGSGFGQSAYFTSISEEIQQPTEIELFDIKLLLDWLEELWLNSELQEIMTEDEYLEFIKAIEDSINY